MMTPPKTPAPPPPQLTEEQKDKAFTDAYNELCQKHGRQLAARIVKRQSQDTGGWFDFIEFQIARMQK